MAETFLKTAMGFVNARYIIALIGDDASGGYRVIYRRRFGGIKGDETDVTTATDQDAERLLGIGWDGMA